jgi:hypothetical protein
MPWQYPHLSVLYCPLLSHPSGIGRRGAELQTVWQLSLLGALDYARIAFRPDDYFAIIHKPTFARLYAE